MMNDGIPSSSSDSAISSKEKKNRRATFKIQMKIHCLYIKSEYYALFKNGFLKTAFVLRPLNAFLKSEVDRLSLQQLEYEIDRADLSDDYNCLEIGYYGYPTFPYAHIQLEQANKLILSYFQE